MIFRLVRHAAQAGRIGLTGSELLFVEIAFVSIAGGFDLQGGLCGFGVGLQRLYLRLVTGDALGHVGKFGFAAMQLITQGIAFLLEIFQASLQGSALGLQLPGKLDQLPDAGGEGV